MAYFYYNGSIARAQFDAEMLHVVHRYLYISPEDVP
jgi:hypothetical protein